MSWHRLQLPLTCLFLALVTVSCYWSVSGHPFVAYDDGFYIVDNPQVTAGLSWPGLIWACTTFHEANWHPLTWLSHQLDASLYGLWAGGHHLTNLVIHTLNTLLLFLLLLRLTLAPWRSVMVAALFALHPLHVESVAWVAERKDLLCALFVLLALHAYRRYAASGRRRDYGLTLLAFIAALLAKPMAVTLPFLLLLLDVWPLDRLRTGTWWALLREKTPLLLLSAASSVITIIAQQAGGALISTHQATIGMRLANAVVSVAKYLGRTFWPHDLAPLYPFPLQIPWWQTMASTLLLTALLLAAAGQRRQRAYLLIGLLWFLGMLVPVSGLMQVGQQALADRYTYLPLIGVFVALVWLVADLSAAWRYRPEIVAPLGLALLLCCWLLTRQQLTFWQSSETLFRRTLAVSSRNYVMHINLGNELRNQGRHPEAITEYLNAVGILPYSADTHYYLADGLHAAGKLAEAATQYRVALELKPDFPEAHNNLGATLYKLGRLAEAVHHYREALRLNPADNLARTNLRTTQAELANTQDPDRRKK